MYHVICDLAGRTFYLRTGGSLEVLDKHQYADFASSFLLFRKVICLASMSNTRPVEATVDGGQMPEQQPKIK